LTEVAENVNKGRAHIDVHFGDTVRVLVRVAVLFIGAGATVLR
jgi:hypothetical protein